MYKNVIGLKIAALLLTIISISLLGLALVAPLEEAEAANSGFVKRAGNQLTLNGQPFRFAGVNIHWLGLDENIDGIDYPSNFRVNDAMLTAKEMGVTVIRSHTLAASTGCSKCIMPTLGVYNETALSKVDYAIKRAGELGLRLVLPLTDNYYYYHGGKHNFTDWRGRGEEAFYTDPIVIADFKAYINHMLNRVNTLTGLAYKDDSTIMAWETGNELISPEGWTQTIADYIKSLDSQHLVIDGKYWLNRGTLGMNSVDIHSDHLYPMDVNRLVNDATDTRNANKVFIVGEYDWLNQKGGASLNEFLSNVENNAVAGAFFWFLLSHRDTSGFVPQTDGFGLQYPGQNSDLRYRAQVLRTHAFKMRNKAVPTHDTPPAPVILKAEAGNIINWRGSAGAEKYSIERSIAGANGPWTIICDRCTDDFNGFWADNGRPGGNLWYRMRAYNLDSVAGAYSSVYALNTNTVISPPVTPPPVTPPPVTNPPAPVPPAPLVLTNLVDELSDWSKVYSHSPDLSFDSSNSGFFENDQIRLRRNNTASQEVVWKQTGLTSFEAVGFFWPGEGVSHLSFFTSADGNNWTAVNPTISGGGGDWKKYSYTLSNLTNVTFVKLRWANGGGQFWNPQVSRVTLTSKV